MVPGPLWGQCQAVSANQRPVPESRDHYYPFRGKDHNQTAHVHQPNLIIVGLIV